MPDEKAEVEERAHEIARELRVDVPPIRLSSRLVNGLGYVRFRRVDARWRPIRLVIASTVWRYLSDDDRHTVIAHELAHVRAVADHQEHALFRRAHGPEWQAVAVELGIPPQAYATESMVQASVLARAELGLSVPCWVRGVIQ